MKKGIIEPVEYQYRTRPDWLPDKWTAWGRCTAGAAADYERVPLLHDWHYQVRRLYTMQRVSRRQRLEIRKSYYLKPR